jgi:hypothetical protein
MIASRWLGVSLLTATVLASGATEHAAACSCAPLELDRETFRGSDGAMVGRLVARDPVGLRMTDYRYVVLRVFRGRRVIEPGEVIAVRAAADGAACGLETPLRGREGLFLERRRDRWTGSLCATAAPREMRRAAERAGIAARAAGCG